MKNNLSPTILLSFLKKSILAILIFFGFTNSYGQAGNALNFDGVDDRVDLPFVVSGSYTKEAWVNLSSPGAYNNFISGKATAFWAPNVYGLKLTAGHGGGFNDVQDPTPLAFGVWYHVAVTFDSTSGLMVLYKNGLQVDSKIIGTSYTETIQYIGAFNDGSTLDYVFYGTLDEIRVWNVARTATDILTDMNCSLTGDEPGLDAYYNFDEGVAEDDNTGIDTLFDLSDKCPTYNGTLVNFNLTGPNSNWIASSATITGTCPNADPNILVTGNTLCITSGDNSPSIGDLTDFGLFSGTPVVHTFTITNSGNADLVLASFTITGANATDFSIAGLAQTLSPGASTTFTITFNPVTSGVKVATVEIGNSDTDESNFTFIITGNAGALPVEITFFNAEKGSNNVKLSWQTTAEHNSLGFEIERSNKGTFDWTKIGFVNSNKNSSGTNNYSINDLTPFRGNNYYRLKQIDADRNSKYSQVRYIKYDGLIKPIVIYPTLTTDKLTINIGDNTLLNTELMFVDFSGKIVKKQLVTNQRQEISVSALPKGMYIIRTVNGDSEKFVKQ